ncbi:unnamed protein product [Schistosoma margrebowiei]|uniref:Uncharacterized protein n=1 Tax=Schistosoma margrebowiei TaxID=48269 RepID=A0A183MIX8_9TREM|nr:unnamed protein product [Schistosoma margrebowiei]
MKVPESSNTTKHKHKSRQFFDYPEGEGTKLAVTQPNNDEPTLLKPPVAKKRKKTSKKPVTIRSSDMATESIKSVPPVEIKQRSIDKRRSLVEEEIKDPVVQKDNQSISTSSPMKYEQSKQFSKSKSYYPLPERMQRLRKSTGLGELSTSPDVAILPDFSLTWNLINQENQPLLGSVERTKYDLLVFGRSSYLSNEERIKYESKFLYNPTDIEVPIEMKTGGKLPRYLEDEGYYIGKQPYVAPTNLRRLENRILKEIQMDIYGLKSLNDFHSADIQLINGTSQDQELENKKRLKIQSWFREDGSLDLQPNPLRNIPSRPPLWDEQFNPIPEKLQTVYLHPMSFEMTQNLFNMESKGLTSQNLSTSLSQSKHIGLLNNNNNGNTEYRLHVDIRRVTFDFHPLFSLEHVHVQNLRQIIQAYELTLSRDQVNACIQRVSSMNSILSQDELLEMDYRIEDYYHEISLMRRARNHAEAYEKGLLTSALRAWKRVKEARQTSGCTNTTVRLKITNTRRPFHPIVGLLSGAHPRSHSRDSDPGSAVSHADPQPINHLSGWHPTMLMSNLNPSTKQITNVEQDQADWNQELDDIVNEAKHEYDVQFKIEQKRYEEELAIYKKEKKQQDAALRRQRLRESGQIDGDWEDNAELEREDAQCLAQKTRKNPPIIPKSFNAQVIRDETEVNLRKFRRLPNEPKITVSLVDDSTISSNNECPRAEINRRLKLLEYTYFIKLYYNRKLVETSQPQLLTHNFTLNFNWILPIQIRNQPESIVAKLFEKHGWTSHQIAEFHIGLPNYTDIQNTSIQQMNRSSELDLQHLRFIVTTGSSFKLDQSKSNQKQSSLSSSSSTLSSFVGRQPKILLEDLDGTGEKIVCIPITGTLFATTKWISINSSLINDMDIEACIGYPDRSLYLQGSMKRHVTDLQSLIYPTTSYLQPTQLFQSNPLFLNDTSKDDDKQGYSTSILDPNNTMDAKLLNLIQTATGTHLLPNHQLQMTSYPEVLYHTRASGVNYFQLNFLTECFDFCTDDDLDKSKRIRLIQLRQNHVPGFQNIIIPTFAKQIPDEIFDSLNEKKDPDDVHDVLSKGMKAYKQKRKVYLEKIKLEVNQHFQDILNKKSLREIVIEEEIPNILFLLPFFKRLLQPKRPLRPRYEERRRIGAQYVQNSSLELIVTIHGAYNLPNRCTKRIDQSNYRNKTDNINDLLKPFAVIKFQQNKQSTNSSEGRNPSWNTEFRFPFYLPSDNPKLENMKDPIIINIYDQVIFNQTDSNQNESSHYIQHIEHRLIGSTEIPLSTVYLNTKISGKINLSIPLILQGYETINLVKSSIRPMIDILMTLEPSIYPPTPLIDTFISIESLEVQTSLSKWYQKLSKHKFMTERQFKPLVMNSDCQEILMTRFLTPLNPPEEFLPGTKTGFNISESMLRLARYVSLIPYESDIASFPGLVQVWCTCDQFLSMLCGDEEEHAVLLACYFMYIFKYSTMDNSDGETTTIINDKSFNQSVNKSMNSIYLCIGEAIPEGKIKFVNDAYIVLFLGRTVYILTEDYISNKQITNLIGWRLWNPVTGQHYSVHDVNNPLRSVWGLVNSENILANIQPKQEPWEIVWDLSSRKHWLPVFNKTILMNNKDDTKSCGITHLPQTIQPEKLIYIHLEQHEVDYIKFELETVLRDALMDWRKTKVCLYICSTMPGRSIGERLEKNNGAYYDGLNQLLDRISNKYYIYGFPMNFSYMEPDEIIARVKSKGIHELIGNEFITTSNIMDRGQSIQQRSSMMGFSKTTLNSVRDSVFSSKPSLTSLRLLQSDSLNVQFALNVYVKAYPGPVLSIWIYMAALWRRTITELS